MNLVLAAKARVFLAGRGHVDLEDVAAMALPVVRYRIVVDFRAERSRVRHVHVSTGRGFFEAFGDVWV